MLHQIHNLNVPGTVPSIKLHMLHGLIQPPRPHHLTTTWYASLSTLVSSTSSNPDEIALAISKQLCYLEANLHATQQHCHQLTPTKPPVHYNANASKHLLLPPNSPADATNHATTDSTPYCSTSSINSTTSHGGQYSNLPHGLHNTCINATFNKMISPITQNDNKFDPFMLTTAMHSILILSPDPPSPPNTHQTLHDPITLPSSQTHPINTSTPNNPRIEPICPMFTQWCQQHAMLKQTINCTLTHHLSNTHDPNQDDDSSCLTVLVPGTIQAKFSKTLFYLRPPTTPVPTLHPLKRIHPTLGLPILHTQIISPSFLLRFSQTLQRHHLCFRMITADLGLLLTCSTTYWYLYAPRPRTPRNILHEAVVLYHFQFHHDTRDIQSFFTLRNTAQPLPSADASDKNLLCSPLF